MPYFIDDLEERHSAGHLSLSPVNAKTAIQCSFIGNLDSHPLRQNLRLVLNRIDPQGSIFKVINTAVEKKGRKRDEYLQSILDSQFVLCPRGGGLNSARFFEALALGRIPILIGDETKLPLQDQIDYDRFVVRVPEASIDNLTDLIATFKRRNNLSEASRSAYFSYWNQLQYSHFFRNAFKDEMQTNPCPEKG